VRVGRKAASTATDLTPEMIEIIFGESTLKKRARVNARGCVSLKVDVITSVAVVFATEEVIETNLVKTR
jgi:hypothetical protein